MAKQQQPNPQSPDYLAQNTNLSSFLFGGVPPQAIDLEEVILGSLLLDTSAADIVLEIFKTVNPFYLELNAFIYDVIRKMYWEGQAIDVLTVTQRLKKEGRDTNPYVLIEFQNHVASIAHLEPHCRIVLEKYVKRSLIGLASGIVKSAYDDTIGAEEITEQAEKGIFSFSVAIAPNMEKTSLEVAQDFMQDLERSRHLDIVGIGTGMPSVDNVMSGYRKGLLYVIAARPGMGKTSYMLSILANMVKEKKRIAVFSLEMPNRQLMARIISLNTGIPLSKILNPKRMSDAEYTEVLQATSEFSDYPITWEDTSSLSIYEIKTKCRRLAGKVDMIMLDYIQLATGEKSGTRDRELSTITAGLKGIAKDLDVPVLALAQLSRAVETRGGEKIPQLSDLRESGSLENDADLVAFIYRPEYYGIQYTAKGESTDGLAFFIIAKHRNGALGYIPMHFEKTTTKFSEIRGIDYEAPIPF